MRKTNKVKNWEFQFSISIWCRRIHISTKYWNNSFRIFPNKRYTADGIYTWSLGLISYKKCYLSKIHLNHPLRPSLLKRINYFCLFISLTHCLSYLCTVLFICSTFPLIFPYDLLNPTLWVNPLSIIYHSATSDLLSYIGQTTPPTNMSVDKGNWYSPPFPYPEPIKMFSYQLFSWVLQLPDTLIDHSI